MTTQVSSEVEQVVTVEAVRTGRILNTFCAENQQNLLVDRMWGVRE